MEDVKRILVVSRDTQYCRKAVRYGFSLAGQYGAKLYVIHAIHNPFSLGDGICRYRLWRKSIRDFSAKREKTLMQ